MPVNGASLHRRVMTELVRGAHAQEQSKVAIEACHSVVEHLRISVEESRRARRERYHPPQFAFRQVDARDSSESG